MDLGGGSDLGEHMDGQATSPGESGLQNLANFVGQVPEKEPQEDEEVADTSDESTLEEEDHDESENNGQEDQTEDSEEQSDEEEEEDKPTPVEKISFKVKGEDGKEETVEATTEEISASYLRHSDYTKKTQALAERERQAVEVFTEKYAEIRSDFLGKAEMARSAVLQVAGLKSEDEMAQLAQSDPSAWVLENQRRNAVASYLNNLDQQIQGEREQASAQAQQRQQQWTTESFQKAWTELQKDGIDRSKLANIYEKTTQSYGFNQDELSRVYDARLVRMMRDATAYRELQSKRSEVTKRVAAAPKLPSKQAVPSNERKSKDLNARFRGGRATLNDLAALLR